MRYWRDPDTFDVIKSNPDAPDDPGDVVVIPEADWRRMVREWGFLRGRIVTSHDAMVAEGGRRIDDFIQRTEVE